MESQDYSFTVGRLLDFRGESAEIEGFGEGCIKSLGCQPRTEPPGTADALAFAAY